MESPCNMTESYKVLSRWNHKLVQIGESKITSVRDKRIEKWRKEIKRHQGH